jgi:succinate dehydrogenase hydrophobic anchor subunit
MNTPTQHKGGEFRPGDRYEVPARPTDGGRLFYYVMVRVTGLVLAVLVLGHFAVTHITTDVAETDASFIARRWSSALWLLWDWAMLTAAMLHGVAGVWIIIEDYTPNREQRRRHQRLLVSISALLFVFGLIVIAAAIF